MVNKGLIRPYSWGGGRLTIAMNKLGLLRVPGRPQGVFSGFPLIFPTVGILWNPSPGTPWRPLGSTPGPLRTREPISLKIGFKNPKNHQGIQTTVPGNRLRRKILSMVTVGAEMVDPDSPSPPKRILGELRQLEKVSTLQRTNTYPTKREVRKIIEGICYHQEFQVWGDPHLCKLYGYGLCKGNPTPKTAGYKVQETLHFRYLKRLVMLVPRRVLGGSSQLVSG